MSPKPFVHPRQELVSRAEVELREMLDSWHFRHHLTYAEQVNVISGSLAHMSNYHIRAERELGIESNTPMSYEDHAGDAGFMEPDVRDTHHPLRGKCVGLMDVGQIYICEDLGIPKSECCNGAGEMLPFDVDCPSGCACHPGR